jgi:hypothetical protein
MEQRRQQIAGTVEPAGEPGRTLVTVDSRLWALGFPPRLRAGQALHRLLAHAASKWVFASLHTQPLESEPIRALIRDRLALPGCLQILLQLGPAHTTRATARRPPADLTEP